MGRRVYEVFSKDDTESVVLSALEQVARDKKCRRELSWRMTTFRFYKNKQRVNRKFFRFP